MNIEGWPFLITRNRSIDYRTVVAPDFIIDADVASLLVRETPGEPSERVIFRDIPGTQAGDITLVYQIDFATDGDEQLRDAIGRPIVRVDGIVVRGLHSQLFAENESILRDQLLPEAHRLVEQSFLEFWNSTSTSPEIQPSQAFGTGIETGVEKRREGRTPPTSILSRRRILTGAGVIIAAAFAIFFLRPEFELTSGGIIEDGTIKIDYTCDHGDGGKTLPLEWSNAPDDTTSYALIAEDTASSEKTVIWILYSIPGTITKLPSVASTSTPIVGEVFGTNTSGTAGYEAPCPDEGEEREYLFTLYALRDELNLNGREATKLNLLDAVSNLSGVQQATLEGTYQRKAK